MEKIRLKVVVVAAPLNYKQFKHEAKQINEKDAVILFSTNQNPTYMQKLYAIELLRRERRTDTRHITCDGNNWDVQDLDMLFDIHKRVLVRIT